MVRTLGLGLTLAALWLLLSGQFEWLFYGFGALSVAAVVYLSHRMRAIDAEGFPIQMLGFVFLYWPWLAWEIVKSNVAVARMALDPRLRIDPTMVEVKATQRSDVGRVTYANSITLTPGTVTVAMDDDRFLIHAITHEMAADVESGGMDQRVTALEGKRGRASVETARSP